MVRDNRPGWQAEPPNATPRVGRSGAGVAVEVHAVACLVLGLQFARLAWPGLLQVGVVHGLNQPVLRADDLLGLTQPILDPAHAGAVRVAGAHVSTVKCSASCRRVSNATSRSSSIPALCRARRPSPVWAHPSRRRSSTIDRKSVV